MVRSRLEVSSGFMRGIAWANCSADWNRSVGWGCRARWRIAAAGAGSREMRSQCASLGPSAAWMIRSKSVCPS
jgi:hypothetical protein